MLESMQMFRKTNGARPISPIPCAEQGQRTLKCFWEYTQEEKYGLAGVLIFHRVLTQFPAESGAPGCVSFF